MENRIDMLKLFHKHFKINSNDKLKSLNDLDNDSNIFASNVSDMKDKKIAIYLNDFYSFLVAFFGILKSNKQCIILHKMTSGSDILLIDSDNINNFLDVRTSVTKQYALDIDSVFYLQTSGSSGESKNIAKTIRQMLREAEFLNTFLGVDHKHYFMSSVTHNHMYGMTFKVFLPLICGGEVLGQEMPFVELIFSAVVSQKSVLITSPTLLNSLSQYPHNDVLNKIQIVSAGAKLDESVWQRLKDANILEIYGSTECGVMCYKQDHTAFLRRFDPVKLSLNNDCLVIESPWCEKFYSNDLASIEGDNVTLCGRADRIVKIADKRVNIDSIESVLNTFDLISSSRLDLLDNATHLSGIITLSDSGIELFKRMGKKEIVSRISTFLKPHFGGILRYVYIRDTLPINAQGKITKDAFKESIKVKHMPMFNVDYLDEFSLRASGKVPISCFYFDWHFSDFPIVPGFIEIGFIVNLARHLNINVENIIEIIHAKWIRFICPLDVLEIHLELKNDRLNFEILANNTLSASGKIHIHKAEQNV